MNLSIVYDRIIKNDIKIFTYYIPDTKAATIEVNKRYGIFLNKQEIKDSNEEFLVLTHEYGHCASGATHKLNSKHDLINRHEYKADRKAVLDFLPLESIKNAISSGCQSIYDFSEFLDLPPEFIVKAFKHYKSMSMI